MSKTLRIVLAALLLLGLAYFVGPAQRARAVATYTVNSSGDAPDFSVGDGFCNIDAAGAPGNCTLRAAIQEANFNTDLDTIAFNLSGGTTITPGSALPAISEPAVIDGSTQSGYSGTPIVLLNGASAGGSASGLLITGGGSTVKGLVIGNFGRAGIELSGGASPNTVVGNFLGTNANGSAAAANTVGILIDGSNGNLIGGTGSSAGNLIAYNIQDGIMVIGGATGNAFLGNEFDFNGGLGIDLENDGVTKNDVGDGDSGANDRQNYPVLASAQYDGDLDVSGSLNSAPGTTFRIELFASASCDPTGYGEGHYFIQSTSVTTNGSGDASFNAVVADGPPDSWFITATATLMSGSTPVETSEFSPCAYVTLSTDAPAAGVFVVNSTGDGSDAGAGDEECNVGGGECTLRAAIQQANAGAGPYAIAFNIAGAGPHTIAPASPYPTITTPVYIDGSTEPNFSSTPVIVLNGASTASNGLHLTAGNSYLRSLSIGNFASGAGVYLSGGGGNRVEGSFIGVAANGTTALPNLVGVRIEDSAGNTVGNTLASLANLISGNGTGVAILGSASTENMVIGNLIGTEADAESPLANSGPGVYIENATGNQIGGTGTGKANLIAFNGGDGVQVASGNKNYIPGNSIFSNGGLGIDLGPNGVTANDTGDVDSGANDLQNYPVVSLAGIGGGDTIIQGTFSSKPNQSYRLHFYVSESCDASDYGEGQVYIGNLDGGIGGSGSADFSVAIDGEVPLGSYVTVTATDVNENTSEFSKCKQVVNAPTPTPTRTPTRTPTKTAVASSTSPYTAGKTATPSRTPTKAVTATSAFALPTATRTGTPPTSTATFTLTPTRTPTKTVTPSGPATDTPTASLFLPARDRTATAQAQAEEGGILGAFDMRLLLLCLIPAVLLLGAGGVVELFRWLNARQAG